MIVQIVQVVLAGVLVLGGLFFLTVSSIGVVRLPDFYTRNHAVGKTETLGSILILSGLAIYHGWEINSLKLIVILIFIGVANPTATHIIANAAFRARLQPWVLKRSNSNKNDRSQAGQPGIKDIVKGKEE
jgi:multicomponent Na+:H+ antiporter subunit G